MSIRIWCGDRQFAEVLAGGCPETGGRKEGALMEFEEKDAAREPEENQPRAEDRITPDGKEEPAARASAQTDAGEEQEVTAETAEKEEKKKKTTRTRKKRKNRNARQE